MAKRPKLRVQDVLEDRKRRNLLRKSIRMLLKAHATDVRARGDERPVPKPVPWHHRLIFPDVTASVPLPVRGVMARACSGADWSESQTDNTAGSYQVMVRIETRDRLQEPEREAIWSAMASYARQTGGDFWIVAPRKLRERVAALVTDSTMEEVYVPEL